MAFDAADDSLACLGKREGSRTSTHRRVLLKDLLDYKRVREHARRDAIVRIARQSEELGDYDKFISSEE
jgi:hypothetical protein